MSKTLYLFCNDPHKDPVAHRVFAATEDFLHLRAAGFEVDGWPVLLHEDGEGHSYFYVRTAEVVSHDYRRYLPVLLSRFADFDQAGLVNWHEGANAPDAVFTVHTTGDVASGRFGAADPRLMRNLCLAIERNRQKLGPASFTTALEATHWSGVPHGGSPKWIVEYPVPLLDIEIGSSPACWSNPAAAQVVARSLVEVFAAHGEPPPRSLLCVGGVHVEPAFRAALFGCRPERPLAVSHILPNHWLDGYDSEEGAVKLDACVASILGGIHG